MKTNPMKKFILFAVTLLMSQASWGYVCSQTLSPGANIASAIASAANGATICLNSGNYGSVSFANIARTGHATIASASGVGAVMSPAVGNSKYIRFQNMSLTGMLINNKSTNIEIVSSVFVPNQTGLAVVDSSNILIDNVDFTNVNQATWSGRLSLNNASYTTVTNSKFAGVGTSSSNVKQAAADGIMVIGNANNNKIGPNNVFTGILQNLCDVANPGSHCDSIQFYGAGPNNVITGNFFYNDHIYVMAPDGSDNVTVTNNVFGDGPANYPWKVQFGSTNNTRFEHNTLINCGATFDSKPTLPASINVTVKNNISRSGNYKTTGGNGCSNCTLTRNIYSTTSSAMGTDNVIGNPTFVGGTTPTTYAGYQLAANSIGYKAATDGSDIGVIISGPTSAPAPAPAPAPTTPTTIEPARNLRKI